MESNQEKIKEHYDNAKEIGTARRELLATINIRKMNNFIKSMLINEHVLESASVLDIGCGKGGDLKKYAGRSIMEYFGIDISEQSVQNAEKRYRSSPLRFKANFLVADAYGKPIKLNKQFDIISIQFSFHYAFSSEECLETSLMNIKNHLKTNGKLIATVPNSTTLLRRYSKYGNGYGNDFYSIKFKESYEQIASQARKLGVEYKFTLQDSLDDCVEYLIDMKSLKSECEKVGLSVIEYTDFVTYFNQNAKKYLALHNKMIPSKLNNEELRVCELYSVLVLLKK